MLLRLFEQHGPCLEAQHNLHLGAARSIRVVEAAVNYRPRREFNLAPQEMASLTKEA